MTGLSTATIAAKSYELFKTIMESEVAQGDKMEAARLALGAAYRPGLTPVPPVGDPKHVLNFLRYHLDPRVKREDCIHVISAAMRAIDAASNDPTSRSGDWRTEDAGELLTGFQREIERVKELEGATAVVTLEEAYGRLSAVIDDMNVRTRYVMSSSAFGPGSIPSLCPVAFTSSVCLVTNRRTELTTMADNFYILR